MLQMKRRRLFLKKNRLLEIPRIIEKVMESHSVMSVPDLDAIIEMDLWARDRVKEMNYN